jgi:hypothetical protein
MVKVELPLVGSGSPPSPEPNKGHASSEEAGIPGMHANSKAGWSTNHTWPTIRTMEVMSSDSLPVSEANRPGRVVKLNGVIVQSDKTSWLGAWIIRPVEMLDLHLAGMGREIGSEPLAIHAGLDVGRIAPA